MNKTTRPDTVEIIRMLSLSNRQDVENLFKQAYQIKKQMVGTTVYFRGIVEISNICKKNCYYCGIRRDNQNVVRFRLTEEEVIKSALWAFEQHYGSVVLQSGERDDDEFVCYIKSIVKELKTRTDGRLGITLSLGEQTEETYARWYEAGAHRYLLRIETSSPNLYQKLHPSDHDWQVRWDCIRTLKKLGYQTGTGVMIGLPYQTLDDLARDVQFFYDEDIDMIGMGPFIPHAETPLASAIPDYDGDKQLELALKMIAVCRILLQDINIASTTALQALKPDGRELGLLAGANIIMPNITDPKYRVNYQLYNGKPCLDENASLCRNCLETRVASIGETIGYDQWGDSPHFKQSDKHQ